jgi:hypothetical protein
MKGGGDMVANHFGTIDGKPVTRWTMIDGNIMTGRLVMVAAGQTSFLVLRPDGTTCIVPSEQAEPATAEDVLSSLSFFNRGTGGNRYARR